MSSRKWIVLFCAALAIRLGLWAWFAPITPGTFDEREFNALATNLAERGEYAIRAGELTSARPPLYAGFVAVIYAAFGVENYQAVRLAQVLLNLLTVLVVACLAYRVLGEKAAFGAALLSAFYPSLLGHSYLLLTEVLFSFLLSLAALLLAFYLERGRLAWAILAGMVFALSALTRSVMWLFPPWALLMILLSRHLSWWRRALGAVLLVAAFAATLTPWAIRNTRLQGALTIVDTSGGRILRWAWSVPDHQPRPSEKGLTEGQVEHQAVGTAFSSLARHPQVVLERVATHAVAFWGLERELVAGAAVGHFGPLSRQVLWILGAVICGYYAIVMLTAIVGVAAIPPLNRPASALILLLGTHIFLVHALVFGHSRYHIPVVTLLTIYSGGALAAGTSLWQRRNAWKLACALAAFAVLAATWVYEFLARDFSAVMHGSGG